MNEFNNRIELQREVIKIVNQKRYDYQITGLSDSAIKRWISDNTIDKDSELTKLIYEVSSKLFFLANKSQEQITDSYKNLSMEVSDLVRKLRSQVSKSN